VKHPSDEELRGLALGQLATGDSIRVQRHLSRCHEACLNRLIEIELQLRLSGPLSLSHEVLCDPRRPLFLCHDTADGLFYLRVERQGRKWLACHWGDQVEGIRECRTMREANERAIQDFRAMFPEHRCTARCCANPPLETTR